jgi:hypothetical protein
VETSCSWDGDAFQGALVPRSPALCWVGSAHPAELVFVSTPIRPTSEFPEALLDRFPHLPRPSYPGPSGASLTSTHPLCRIVLGASSLAFVTIYPFMKRVTYYPQIVFGESASALPM